MGFSQAPDLIGEMEMSLNHGICYVNCRDEVRAAHPEYFMMMRKFGIKFSHHHPQGDVVRDAFIKVKSLAEWRGVIDTFYSAQLQPV